MCVEMFYLQLYGIGNMVKDNSAREEAYFHHYMEYSFQSAARELLYVLSRHNDTYHGICYTSHTALAVCVVHFLMNSLFFIIILERKDPRYHFPVIMRCYFKFTNLLNVNVYKKRSKIELPQQVC